MKVNKGFTLIELLAVIVILAIIALIATPMILGVIETAKKGASESSALGYMDAVEKQVAINELDSTKTKLNDGVYEISELQDTEYGITVKGEIPESGWIVIENGTIANYSFVIDEYVVTKGEDTKKGTTTTDKPSGSEKKAICKKVEKEEDLHTEQCTQTDTKNYCSGSGYVDGNKGTIVRYGTIVDGDLKSGDAFDCDVDGNGTYDEDERFYYVIDMDNVEEIEGNETAVLIYYSNTVNSDGNIITDNTSNSLIAYDSLNENWHGPVTAVTNLPTRTQWGNVSFKSVDENQRRTITNESGESNTNNGANTIENPFSYEGYAARLLTTQEVDKACNLTAGSYSVGSLDKCNYLLENTNYSNSSNVYGYWLETPFSSYDNRAWNVNGRNRSVSHINTNNTSSYGIRPAIEVLKSDIDY